MALHAPLPEVPTAFSSHRAPLMYFLVSLVCFRWSTMCWLRLESSQSRRAPGGGMKPICMGDGAHGTVVRPQETTPHPPAPRAEGMGGSASTQCTPQIRTGLDVWIGVTRRPKRAVTGGRLVTPKPKLRSQEPRKHLPTVAPRALLFLRSHVPSLHNAKKWSVLTQVWIWLRGRLRQLRTMKRVLCCESKGHG